jgi:hypothetical protein
MKAFCYAIGLGSTLYSQPSLTSVALLRTFSHLKKVFLLSESPLTYREVCTRVRRSLYRGNSVTDSISSIICESSVRTLWNRSSSRFRFLRQLKRKRDDVHMQHKSTYHTFSICVNYKNMIT